MKVRPIIANCQALLWAILEQLQRGIKLMLRGTWRQLEQFEAQRKLCNTLAAYIVEIVERTNFLASTDMDEVFTLTSTLTSRWVLGTARGSDTGTSVSWQHWKRYWPAGEQKERGNRKQQQLRSQGACDMHNSQHQEHTSSSWGKASGKDEPSWGTCIAASSLWRERGCSSLSSLKPKGDIHQPLGPDQDQPQGFDQDQPQRSDQIQPQRPYQIQAPGPEEYQPPGPDQDQPPGADGFRKRRSTTTALQEITTYIRENVNIKKPAHRTVMVAVDLMCLWYSKSYNTHQRHGWSSTQQPNQMFLAAYLRGRQTYIEYCGAKSKMRRM